MPRMYEDEKVLTSSSGSKSPRPSSSSAPARYSAIILARSSSVAILSMLLFGGWFDTGCWLCGGVAVAVVSRLFGGGWRFFVSFYVGIDLVAKNARENKHGTTAQLVARPLDLSTSRPRHRTRSSIYASFIFFICWRVEAAIRLLYAFISHLLTRGSILAGSKQAEQAKKSRYARTSSPHPSIGG